MVLGDPRLQSLYQAAEAAFVASQTAGGVKTWLDAEVRFLQATGLDFFVQLRGLPQNEADVVFVGKIATLHRERRLRVSEEKPSTLAE